VRSFASFAVMLIAGCHLINPLAPLPKDAGSPDTAGRDAISDGPAPDGSRQDAAPDGRGWTLVYKLETGTCPSGWAVAPEPGGCMIGGTLNCTFRQGGVLTGAGNSASFKVQPPAPYRAVRGFVQGVQWHSTDGFDTDLGKTIDDPYVEGVSITHGAPRQHIWTYASGLTLTQGSASCPCKGGTQPPAFVGGGWTCDSGNPKTTWDMVWYTQHPLWGADAEGPGCAPPVQPGWFEVTLPTEVNDDIEVRILFDSCDENIAVTELELHVR
jgi:hypothetical protein